MDKLQSDRFEELIKHLTKEKYKRRDRTINAYIYLLNKIPQGKLDNIKDKSTLTRLMLWLNQDKGFDFGRHSNLLFPAIKVWLEFKEMNDLIPFVDKSRKRYSTNYERYSLKKEDISNIIDALGSNWAYQTGRGDNHELIQSKKDQQEVDKDRLLVEFMFITGARLTETLLLSNENKTLISDGNFYWKDNEIHIPKEVTKSKSEEKIYLTQALKQSLRDYIKKYSINGRLFDYSKSLKIKDWKKESLSKRFRTMKGILREMNIFEYRLRNANRFLGYPRLSPHMLRHCNAMTLKKKNVDLDVIQRLLRHRNISTTQIYARVDDTDAKKAHDEVFE